MDGRRDGLNDVALYGGNPWLELPQFLRPDCPAGTWLHKTLPLTKFELAAVTGIRAMMLDADYHPHVQLSPQEEATLHGVDIARKELDAGVCSLNVLRYLPDGTPYRIQAQDAYDLAELSVGARLQHAMHPLEYPAGLDLCTSQGAAHHR